MTNIGDILRQARIEKGYSMEDMQQKTKIPQRYLMALEENRFEDLPGSFYGEGFIQQYAKVVGIDEKPLLLAYKEGGQLASSSPTLEEDTTYSRKSKPTKSKTFKKKLPWPLIILVLVVVSILSVVVVATVKDHQKNPVIARPKAVIIHSSEETQASTAPKKEAPKKEPEKKVEKPKEPEMELAVDTNALNLRTIPVALKNVKKPLVITLSAPNGRCWVGVKVNNQFLLNQTLEVGGTASYTVPDGVKNFQISLGAASFAEVSINGKKVVPDFKALGPNSKNFVVTVE